MRLLRRDNQPTCWRFLSQHDVTCFRQSLQGKLRGGAARNATRQLGEFLLAKDIPCLRLKSSQHVGAAPQHSGIVWLAGWSQVDGQRKRSSILSISVYERKRFCWNCSLRSLSCQATPCHLKSRFRPHSGDRYDSCANSLAGPKRPTKNRLAAVSCGRVSRISAWRTACDGVQSADRPFYARPRGRRGSRSRPWTARALGLRRSRSGHG